MPQIGARRRQRSSGTRRVLMVSSLYSGINLSAWNRWSLPRGNSSTLRSLPEFSKPVRLSRLSCGSKMGRCADAEPEAFIRQIARMSYDLQAEWYVKGGKALSGSEPTFVFLAQEIMAPYACSLISLANSYREVGKSKVSRAVAIWNKCVRDDSWPAYSTRIHYAEPTSWQLTDELEVKKPQSDDEELA